MTFLRLKFFHVTICLLWCISGETRAQTDPTIYAIVVGNNKFYDEPAKNSAFADDDAIAIAETLRQFVGVKNIRLHVNPDDATRGKRALESLYPVLLPSMKNLKSSIHWVEERAASDVKSGKRVIVIFYFAGHGERSQSIHLEDGLLSFEELGRWFEWSNSKSVTRVDWRDACYGFDLVSSMKGNTQHIGSTEYMREYSGLSGGVLTSMLISGLAGPADKNRNGEISLREIGDWLQEQLKRSSLESGVHISQPVMDDTLVRLRGRPSVVIPANYPTSVVQVLEFLETQQLRRKYGFRFQHGSDSRIALTPGKYALIRPMTRDDIPELIDRMGLWSITVNAIEAAFDQDMLFADVQSFSVDEDELPAEQKLRESGGLVLVELPSRRGELGSIRAILPNLDVWTVPIDEALLGHSFMRSNGAISLSHFRPKSSLRLAGFGAIELPLLSVPGAFFCSSGVVCGVNVEQSWYLQQHHFKADELGLRLAFQYEASQQSLGTESLIVNDVAYHLFARHSIGLGIGSGLQLQRRRISLSWQETVWWMPTTLWGYRELIRPKHWEGLVLRGGIESSVSLQWKPVSWLQMGPELSWMLMHTDLLNGVGLSLDALAVPTGYREIPSHGKVGLRVTFLLAE